MPPKTRGGSLNAIEIAIRMEKDAIDFYTAAADKTNNPIGKKMFLSIRKTKRGIFRHFRRYLRKWA